MIELQLPSDLKRFYLLFNGLHLRWSIRVIDQSVLIGEIKIHKLDQILPLQIDGQFIQTEVSGFTIPIPESKTSSAYVFASCEEGLVVLLYRSSSQQLSPLSSSSSLSNSVPPISTLPEVWFIDNTKRWHFICFSFTQYLRLAVLHLGIIGWHYVFVPEGITMTTRQWMGMFCRERLCIYQNQRVASSSPSSS